MHLKGRRPFDASGCVEASSSAPRAGLLRVSFIPDSKDIKRAVAQLETPPP